MRSYQVYDEGEAYRIKATVPACSSMGGWAVQVATMFSIVK